MSFHPLMVYDAEHFHKSERARLDEGGALRVHARAPRESRRHPDEVSARSEAFGGACRVVSGAGAAGLPDGQWHAPRRLDSRHDPG